MEFLNLIVAVLMIYFAYASFGLRSKLSLIAMAIAVLSICKSFGWVNIPYL